METISVRMDTENLQFLSKVLEEPQSELIRDLVKEGKLMKALVLYRQKKISLGLAAKIASVPLGEFIDILGEFGMTLNIELEETKKAYKYAAEILK